MKRIFSLILTLVILLCFTACSGNFAQVDLKEPIELSDNGIVEKSVFEKIKKENAIAIFTGESSEIKYEWTIFGSDLKDVKDVNLSVALEKTDKGIKIKFKNTKDFGFPALLSIRLNEKWNADSANAFANDKAVFSVSITGSKTSILNISVNKIVAECEIIPYSINQTKTTSSTKIKATDNDKKDSSKTNKADDYLSSTKDSAKKSNSRVYSDGKATDQDKYKTDPVPKGKPLPVEPQDKKVDKKKAYTCTFSIECSALLNNLSTLNPDKRELIPSNGVILAPTKVTFYEGESVFDALERVCKQKGIHLEFSSTPIYNSAYIEGIYNLYEFDCGSLSGWMYRVNGWYPNYGCSRYQLTDGEKVEFRYTCDLGKDIGCDWMGS